ncbi:MULTISPECIES: PssE/Cps14G family polysaccharide biosynthesis glycosyltransferase [Bacillus cereus group]|uniref:PssE/Cps14G family polysaccharide biosynthesis glycosyltransferase n=1 Tax=Bacillus cereus group TaxID=86661 RepID=UPI00132F36F5|nr:PssE/Cps14G family polysaccharide biosynthesis glycosyltransferase [Bacillus cereus group sp. Bc061]MDA2597068.1 glycosyltransferase [Bacillus cereus group sp. Bc061]QHH87260.1 multidrug MFS transporter [Bacillus paranthracis]HDR7253089.1 multidrug MFS transporter [Bacillus pacificus]
MIFVTTGTHEQQFNRLVKKIDEMKKNKEITDEVFIQYGYSTYIPKYCKGSKLIGYNEMMKKMEEASVIITHGGPGSIMTPLSLGKTPIVVPRNKDFDEHVDNHQIDFVKRLEKKRQVIAVYDINQMREKIQICLKDNTLEKSEFITNNPVFIEKFKKMIQDILA